MNRLRLLLVVCAPLCAAAPGWSAATGERTPVMFQSAPGRYEVAAVDVDGAQRVVALASEAWQHLAAPLALPEAFTSPIFVRLIPAADWPDAVPFRVIVEAGGVVSVRVRWEAATPESYVRRALVQGLLIRQAVARHGVQPRLAAPLWLEHACVGWWRIRAEPAQLDALKQTAARFAAPALPDLLDWQRGRDEPESFVNGAVWLLTFLSGESTRTGAGAGEWPSLLSRLLGGEAPAPALAATYPGRFANDTERELWWQTGWQQLRTARVLPGFEAADSRAELAALARFVFLRDGADVVVPVREVLAHASEPAVDADLKRRLVALNRVLPVLHPFYRNAALSLAEALVLRESNAKKREATCAVFDQDWRDAVELEVASTTALDAMERSRPVSPIK